MTNRKFCYFHSGDACYFPVACPRDSHCRREKLSIPVPNSPDIEYYKEAEENMPLVNPHGYLSLINLGCTMSVPPVIHWWLPHTAPDCNAVIESAEFTDNPSLVTCEPCLKWVEWRMSGIQGRILS